MPSRPPPRRLSFFRFSSSFSRLYQLPRPQTTIPRITPWCKIGGMGKLEEKAHKQRKREDFQRAVLEVVAAAGIVTLSAVAFPLVIAIGRIAEQSGYRVRYRAKTAAGRLAQKGLVKFVEKNGKKHIEITEAGRRMIALEHARASAPARAKRRWDKRYRLVMFDIPQHKRSTRDRLRRMMLDFGFLRVQYSVWVSPYDCEELIAL